MCLFPFFQEAVLGLTDRYRFYVNGIEVSVMTSEFF